MEPTRNADKKIAQLFCTFHPVSEHLTKKEDVELPDKYDNNSFYYSGQPTAEEFRRAVDYQKAKGVNFIQLNGYEPLENAFGMEPDHTLTMVLPKEADINWKTNPDVILKAPGEEELERHELKYYGPLYGDSFAVRNNRRLRQKLTYHGAYLEGRLAGACYAYRVDGYTCMDDLVVDSDYRHRYVASTLIRALAETARREGNLLYLHADPEDTPKDMYRKMGFQVVDKEYGYLCTDLGALKLD